MTYRNDIMRPCSLLQNTSPSSGEMAAPLAHPKEEAAEEKSMALNWSEHPGCFERHLQRKYGNPLFPPDARAVTQEQVDLARLIDWAEAEEVRQRFLSLAGRIAKAPESVPYAEALDVRKAIDDLLARAAEIGGPLKDDVPEFFRMYELAVQEMLAALHDKPDLAEQLRFALAVSTEKRKRFNNPFVAQLERKDTPIRPEEVIPSLLSETPETIRLMVEMVSDQPGALSVLRASVSELVANSAEARKILIRQPEKLMALGLSALGLRTSR
jgi:hypothetical protein